MTTIATDEAWIASRLELLEAEKAFQHARDELTEKRRALPWRKITADYVFDGEFGPRSIRDLFDGQSQLVVYHFMYHPDWDEGCKSCSFWADSYDGMIAHLKAREARYNYRSSANVGPELPGLSVFAVDEKDGVLHTYSTYARGLDNLNPVYQILDLVPKGRDEGGLLYPMDWVRRHDDY